MTPHLHVRLGWALAPVFPLWLGLAYLLGPSTRFGGASLRTVRDIAPLELWGFIWLCVAFLLACVNLGGRVIVVVANALAATVFGTWAGMFLISAVTVETASLTAPAPYLLGTLFYMIFTATAMYRPRKRVPSSANVV